MIEYRLDNNLDLEALIDVYRKGIGTELIRHTRDAAPEAILILPAAPKAAEHYPHIGITRHESAWILQPHRNKHLRGRPNSSQMPSKGAGYA